MSVEHSRPDFLRTGVFALRLIWRADPRRFAAVLAVQLVTAIGLTASLLLIRHVLGIGLATGADVGAAGRVVLPGVLVVLAVQAAGSVLRSISQGWQRVLAVKTDRHIVDLVLRSAGRTELASYDDPAFYDRLQRAIFASRTEPVTLVAGLAVFLRAGLGLIAVAGAFLALAWWLLPLCLLAVLPVVVAARKERDARYRMHTSLAENRRSREYLERLLTSRDDAKEIKALDLGGTLRDRWRRAYREEIRLTTQVHRDHLRLGIAARLLSDGVTAAIVGVGWLLVHQGLIDLATALAVLTALLLLSLRMKATAFLAGTLGDTLIYLADLRNFVDESDQDEPAATTPYDGDFATLTADRVSFAYPGAGEPVLRQISLTLRRGEVVALVGANGSGKTTLAKILAGLYTPTDGQIVGRRAGAGQGVLAERGRCGVPGLHPVQARRPRQHHVRPTRSAAGRRGGRRRRAAGRYRSQAGEPARRLRHPAERGVRRRRRPVARSVAAARAGSCLLPELAVRDPGRADREPRRPGRGRPLRSGPRPVRRPYCPVDLAPVLQRPPRRPHLRPGGR